MTGRREVVEAAEQGRFHIYPVKTVDEPMELLCGVAADELNQRTEARLRKLAEIRQEFVRPEAQGQQG